MLTTVLEFAISSLKQANFREDLFDLKCMLEHCWEFEGFLSKDLIWLLFPYNLNNSGNIVWDSCSSWNCCVGTDTVFLNSRFLGGRKTTGGRDLAVTCAKFFIICGFGGYLLHPFYLSLYLIPCPQLQHLNGGLGNMWGSFWNTIFKELFTTAFYTLGINIIASWQLQHVKTFGKPLFPDPPPHPWRDGNLTK